jgi:hypothetical protein
MHPEHNCQDGDTLYETISQARNIFLTSSWDTTGLLVLRYLWIVSCSPDTPFTLLGGVESLSYTGSDGLIQLN